MSKADGTVHRKAAFARAFGRYQRSTGKDAYVISEMFTAGGIGPHNRPHILRHHDAAALMPFRVDDTDLAGTKVHLAPDADRVTEPIVISWLKAGMSKADGTVHRKAAFARAFGRYQRSTGKDAYVSEPETSSFFASLLRRPWNPFPSKGCLRIPAFS